MQNLNQKMPIIVGIRFSEIGKNYYFDASTLDDLKIGDHIVVETSRGWQIGKLAEIIDDPKILINTNFKPVDRIATEDDLKKRGELLESGKKALEICIGEMKDLKLGGIKVISAEFSFDSKILSFLYSTTDEESPNLSKLINAVGKRIQNTRIDFHKIGPRDVAKYFGGMGVCGFASRCCTKFLCQFESISIRMAKKQGISLTPSDITGMCDRLRCCLGYEYCQYVETLKNMPRKNTVVMTPKGKGKVKDLAPLRNAVYIQLEEIGVIEFDVEEIEEITSANPSESGRDRNQSGKKKGQTTRSNRRT